MANIKKTAPKTTKNVKNVEKVPQESQDMASGGASALEEPVVEENQEQVNEEIQKIIDKNNGDCRKSVFEYCFLKNLPYFSKIIDQIQKLDENYSCYKILSKYEEYVKNNEEFKDSSFFEQIKIDNFEKIYQEDQIEQQLSDEDKKNRQ